MGKVLHSKFQILDVRSSNQTSTAQPSPAILPTFTTPAGWTRKDFPQYSELNPLNDANLVIGVYHDLGGNSDSFALLNTTLQNALERAHATILSQGDISLLKTTAGYNVAAKQLTVNAAGVPPYWLVAAIPGTDMFSFVLCAASTHEALVAHLRDIDSVVDSLRMEPGH